MIDRFATFADRFGGQVTIRRDTIKVFYSDCCIVPTESDGRRGQATLFGTTIVTDGGDIYFVVDQYDDVKAVVCSLE